jgi:hypothetical protein
MADEINIETSLRVVTLSPDKKHARFKGRGIKNSPAIELQQMKGNFTEDFSETQITDNKKQKTILYNRHNILKEEKNYKTDYRGIFYLVCYDPIENEIFFSSFEGEDLITLDKDIILRYDVDKELKNRLEEFSKDWNRIKTLSHFEEEEYISEKSYNYFRRPFNSKFLYPEKLGLNHLTSTYPLPAAFQSYKEVSIEIIIHETVFNMNELPENLRFTFIRKVGFYYV